MLAEWVQLTISQLGSADGLTKWVQLLMSHSPALAGGIHEGAPHPTRFFQSWKNRLSVLIFHRDGSIHDRGFGNERGALGEQSVKLAWS